MRDSSWPEAYALIVRGGKVPLQVETRGLLATLGRKLHRCNPVEEGSHLGGVPLFIERTNVKPPPCAQLRCQLRVVQ